MDDDIATLKTANLDLFLYLGRDLPGTELSACSGFGTWSVQQQSRYNDATIPGQFWDMYESNRDTRYGPQVVEQRQNQTKVIYRSSVATNFLSLALNEDAAYWEIAQVLAKQLSDADRKLIVTRHSIEDNSVTPPIPNYLSKMTMAGFLVKWSIRTLHHEFVKRLFREQWSIALQAKNNGPTTISDIGMKIVRPPRDRFYADPFLIEQNGRNYLFFEDYRFSSQKGLISCCEVDDEGNCSRPCVVLERKYHLSYPFLFNWEGGTYMIPETRDNGTIEMYKAVDFPYSWAHEAVLMSDVAATDSTLLHHNDKWWLFTAGLLNHTSPNKTLNLFFSDSPLGPWKPHPRNPIISNIGHARPAGCLYFDNEELIRPGQDCSQGYGYAVQLHRVDILSETDYRETMLESITPDRISGSRGIHTLNHNARFWVFDCKFLISRFDFTLFDTAERSNTETSNFFAL